MEDIIEKAVNSCFYETPITIKEIMNSSSKLHTVCIPNDFKHGVNRLFSISDITVYNLLIDTNFETISKDKVLIKGFLVTEVYSIENIYKPFVSKILNIFFNNSKDYIMRECNVGKKQHNSHFEKKYNSQQKIIPVYL